MRKIRRAGAIGNVVEYLDYAVYGFFAVTISKLFFPEFSSLSALLSTFALTGVSFVARPLGAIVFGHMGDRWGRKKALIGSISMMSLGTALIGALPTYSEAGIAAPLLLLACKLLQGFSEGGESTTAFVLVAEHSAPGTRGRNSAPLVSATSAATVCAALIGMAVISAVSSAALDSWGWRVPFLVAIPLGLVGLLLRMTVDDADIYKKTSSRRTKATSRNYRVPLVQAFRKEKRTMLVFFLWAGIQAASGFVVVVYMPAQLMRFDGHSQIGAYAIMAVALGVATVVIPLFGRIADRISRKSFAILLSVGMTVWSYPAFLLMGGSAVIATIALAIFATVQYATMLLSGIAVIELFPVEIRASAAALPYAVSFALFGGGAPLVATYLASALGPTAPALYVAVLSAAGVLVGWLGLPNGERDGGARGRDIPELTTGTMR
jgi:MHS family proline/betaine transporter-like MFS transporter